MSEQEMPPQLKYPSRTAFERVREIQKDGLNPFTSERWDKNQDEFAALNGAIKRANSKGGQINLVGARKDIDMLVQREIEKEGEDHIKDALKLYNDLAFGDLAGLVGCKTLGYEMLAGYERWLSRNARNLKERVKHKATALLGVIAPWGGIF